MSIKRGSAYKCGFLHGEIQKELAVPFPQSDWVAEWDETLAQVQRLVEAGKSIQLPYARADHLPGTYEYLDEIHGRLFALLGIDASGDPLERLGQALEAIRKLKRTVKRGDDGGTHGA